ncbi:hypothetical protein BGX27_003091, partial [Mortierella sp. AM989]
MRREFSFGFESYDGLPWTLPSGASIDEVVLEITQCLKFETPLHSFIIDDRLESVILDRLPNDADKSEFQTFINNTDNKEYGFELPEWMALEMSRLDLDPKDLFDVLSKDWSNLDTGTIPQGIAENELVSFRSCIYLAFFELYDAYKRHNFDLGSTAFGEGYYRSFIWRFIHTLLNDKRLQYDTGEVTSSASTMRKNSGRLSTTTRSIQGRKFDGIICEPSNKLELCAIEFGKLDSGQNATKSMNDRLKVSK